MISLNRRNGKLNILFRRLEFDHIIDTSFFIMLCAQFCINKDVNNPYYIGFFLFVGMTLIKVIMRLRYDGTVNIPLVCWWFVAFTLFSLASVLWSEYPSVSITIMSRFVQIIAVVFCMAQNYATKDGFNRCMKLICWAGIFCAFYIFIKTPSSFWFRGGLGRSATGANVNVIGVIMTVCILFSIFYAYYQKKRIYYIFAFVELSLTVLTGSRKSILTILMAFILITMLKDFNYKIIFRVAAACALIVLLLYLMMNVKPLYRVIGQRLESMMEYIQSDSGDYSMYARNLFIQYAQQFFLEKPFIGAGVSTFIRKLGAEIGMYAYAHNNYYEILVGVGLIGFSIYYSFYVYLLAKLSKMVFRFGDDRAKILLVMLVSIMICEYGIVLYYSVYAIVFLCLAFVYVCAFDNEHGVKRNFISESSRMLLKSENVF